MMRIVTIWSRLNKTGIYEHNHISNGFIDDQYKPTPINSNQEKLWTGTVWRKVKGYLDDNNILLPMPPTENPNTGPNAPGDPQAQNV